MTERASICITAWCDGIRLFHVAGHPDGDDVWCYRDWQGRLRPVQPGDLKFFRKPTGTDLRWPTIPEVVEPQLENLT